jgi:predicted nucleotide-binding protein (sugar kinase/HSP70/actin superfamily)
MTFGLELLNYIKLQRKTIKFRKYTDINVLAINEIMQPYLTDIDFDMKSANELVTYYEITANDIVNKLYPTIEKVITFKETNPWYNSSIIALRRARRRTEKVWRNSNSESARHEYVLA